ncbi:MAG: phage portal protein, partial [Paludibacteraceae bacterium]|nr:phage portal protein [Paludibacteraceae bacterium]
AYWMFTYGLAYRLVLNDKAMEYANGDVFDEAPFEVYTLDPRNTFIAKLNDVTRKVVMGVTYVYLDKNKVRYTVYTQDATYTVDGTAQRAEKVVGVPIVHNFGYVPIVEYPCNSLRMGAFEIVLDLLDAINLTESNRLDGVEQFIQALMIFKGVDITREQFLSLKDLGAIALPPAMDGRAAPDIDYLCEQLDQNQTQTLVDALYQEILQIVGMPSQGNANTADSSNNGAVIMKNGWWGAESRAKETVGMWREAETNFLKIVLKICREANAVDLNISDIELKFGRSSYEDLITKTQAFSTLIAANCPPIQAFTLSHLTVDPESAAIVYEQYQQDEAEKLSLTASNEAE